MRLKSLTVGFLAFLYIGWHGLVVPRLVQDEVEVRIEKGTPLPKILETLKESGVIRHPTLVALYLRLTGQDHRIKYGRFRLRRGLHDLYAIREFLRAPDQGVPVRILEGMDLKEIAGLLARTLEIDSEEILSLARDSSWIRDLFRRYFPEVSPPPTIEGYLFPDTYYFSEGTPAPVVLRVIFHHTVEVLRPLLPVVDSTGFTLHQVLTLASIVEKEALYDRERPIIASVFLNRLRLKRPLESCATVEYVLPKRKPVLTYRDLKIPSPYNTYLNPGLPPGPICSPGLKSIQAVLHPAKTDYLYFVAKGDGTHYFSRTFEEHVRAKLLYRRGRQGVPGSTLQTLP